MNNETVNKIFLRKIFLNISTKKKKKSTYHNLSKLKIFYTHLLGTTQTHQYSSSISDACCHGEIDKDGTVQIGFLFVHFAKPHGQLLHNTTSMHRNEPIATRSAISRTSTRYRSHWTDRSCGEKEERGEKKKRKT